MRTYRTQVSLLATAACLLLISGAALPSHAQAFDVFAGYDLFETLPGTNFSGTALTGAPIGHFNFGGTIGDQNTVTTDTIIQRTINAGPSSVGSTVTTPLVMRALSLVTTTPTTFGGLLPLNTYYVFLNPLLSSTGSMDITYGTATSGTFNSSLIVNFDIGTNKNDPTSAVFSGQETFTSSASWSDIAPAGALRIAGVNDTLNGSTVNNDFWSNSFTEVAPPTGIPAFHVVDPAQTPEPGSVALLVASGLGGLSLLRRRRSR